MSARPGVTVAHRVQSSAPKQGSQPSYITVEIRCFWPDNAADVEIEEALNECIRKVRGAVARKRAVQ